MFEAPPMVHREPEPVIVWTAAVLLLFFVIYRGFRLIDFFSEEEDPKGRKGKLLLSFVGLVCLGILFLCARSFASNKEPFFIFVAVYDLAFLSSFTVGYFLNKILEKVEIKKGIQRKLLEEEEYKKNRSRALDILTNGGPKVRGEYYFLFPSSCDKCGCRTMIDCVKEGDDTAVHNSELSHNPNPEKIFWSQCRRCGDASELKYCLYVTERRIYSPWLSFEETNSIPDNFPRQK